MSDASVFQRKRNPEIAVRESRRDRVRDFYYEKRLRLSWSFPIALEYARWRGAEIGDGTIIYRHVRFGSEPWLVKVGRGTWLTVGVEFVTHDGSISVIRNGNFEIDPNQPINRYGPIEVGDNCFIGLHSIIMPGVKIGNDCIVAAGSVVSRDVPDGTIVAGNPARPLGSVADFAKKVAEEALEFPADWPDAATKRATIARLVWERAEARRAGQAESEVARDSTSS
jgi:acetyltransferase-like isoleucine patch superfamily enzyme